MLMLMLMLMLRPVSKVPVSMPKSRMYDAKQVFV